MPEKTTLRWTRALILALAVGAPLVLLRPAVDTFQLPKATLIVAGAIAIGLLAVVRVAAVGVVRWPTSPLTLAAGVFVAGLAVAMAVSDQPTTSLVGTYARYSGLAVYLSCVTVGTALLRLDRPRDTARQVARAVGAAGVAVAAYAVFQRLGLDPFTWSQNPAKSAFSTMGNENFVGAMIGISIPLVAWLILEARGAVRGWLAAAGVVALAGLWAADSVQGYAAALAGLGVMALAWVLDVEGPRRRIALATLAGTASLGIAGFVTGLLGVGPFSVLRQVARVSNRLGYWDAAVNMFLERPFTGVGLDLYGSNYRLFRSQESALRLQFRSVADAPHNVHLQMFAEGGLLLGLGLLAVVVVTAVLLVRGLRRLEGPDALLLGALGGSWLAYQVQAFVSIDVPALALTHWILTGAVVALAAPPALRDLRMPWGPGRESRRWRSTGIATGVVAAVLFVVVLFPLTRPLRASIAEKASRDAVGDNDPSEALRQAERAVELFPWEAHNWLALANVHVALQDFETALLGIAEAADRDPRNPNIWASCGRTARAADQLERSISCYDRALDVEPRSPELKAEVADTLFASGELDRAATLVVEALELAPDRDADWWTLLGAIRADQGRVEDAVEAYEKALALDPDNRKAANRLEQLQAGA